MKDGLRGIGIRRRRASSIPAPSIQTGSSFGPVTARFRSEAMLPEKRMPAPQPAWEISQTPRSAQFFRQPSPQRLQFPGYLPAIFRSAPFLAVARTCARVAATAPDTHRSARSRSSPVENIPAPGASRCAPPIARGFDSHTVPLNAPQLCHPTRRRRAAREFLAKFLSSAATAPLRECVGSGSRRISENEGTSLFRVLLLLT